MKAAQIARMLYRLGAALLLAGAVWTAHAAPPPWPSAPYTYQADNQPLRSTLQEFARHFGLRAQITPLRPPITMRTGRPAPAGDLLRYYKRAQRRFGVAWELLAAVNFVETKFGRVKSRSQAGASSAATAIANSRPPPAIAIAASKRMIDMSDWTTAD